MLSPDSVEEFISITPDITDEFNFYEKVFNYQKQLEENEGIPIDVNPVMIYNRLKDEQSRRLRMNFLKDEEAPISSAKPPPPDPDLLVFTPPSPPPPSESEIEVPTYSPVNLLQGAVPLKKYGDISSDTLKIYTTDKSLIVIDSTRKKDNTYIFPIEKVREFSKGNFHGSREIKNLPSFGSYKNDIINASRKITKSFISVLPPGAPPIKEVILPFPRAATHSSSSSSSVELQETLKPMPSELTNPVNVNIPPVFGKQKAVRGKSSTSSSK